MLSPLSGSILNFYDKGNAMSLSMPKRRILTMSFLVAVNTVYANTDRESNEAYEEKICERLSTLQFPKKDLPTARERKELEKLENCSPLMPRDLYFGINGPQDYVKARKCAFTLYFDDSHSQAMQGINGPSDILTMIYANGKKVKRNLDLASKIVCETRGGYVNSNISIKYLQNLKKAELDKEFDVCNAGIEAHNDEISERNTATSMISECGEVKIDIQNSKAIQLLEKITAKYTSAQKKELEVLLAKAITFFEQQVEWEVNINNYRETNTWMIVGAETEDYQNKSDLKNSLIHSIHLFERGKFPDGSKQQYLKIRAELNEQLTEIKEFYLHNGESLNYEFMPREPTLELENGVQTAWMAYANQFIKFASKRYPQVPEYRWRTWLIEQRMIQLKRYLSDVKDRLDLS